MDNNIYDIETVDFLLTLSEDELREKITEISIYKTQTITLDCVHFGFPSIGFVNGLGLYLYAQCLNLQNFLSPQKKWIMDMVDKRIQDLRHSICGSDVLKNFVEGKLPEADLAIGIAMIIAQKEGVPAEVSLLLSVYLIKKGVLSYCDKEWTL